MGSMTLPQDSPESTPTNASLPSNYPSSRTSEVDYPTRNGFEPIAIVGMGCRLPGAISSPAKLWEFIMAKQMAHTHRVPESRFNIDAYHHQNNERPGSFRIPGGCFLEGSTQEFDPVLFGISPVEALWLDPQQRRLLEVVYEAFEGAGISLEKIAGSATGCFVGNFTADYQQMSFKEHDFRHSYSATGVDPGIVSNRISHVFNLKGPSVVVNTACSSALYALHNACNAIRNHECDGAVIGGVNLILSVDQHMNTAKLGVLSPTSTCHAFDAAADGYSRAEGIGALYIKRLEDAIRDGDPVRAIIRGTAVNSNGKIPDLGFTSPSVQGQSDVIRAAYKAADLDPRLTTYVECHGTGTPTGDPVETRAISEAMAESRTADNPFLVGSIKPNIGHSEASSSISTIIKAVLAVEKGIIPPTAGIKTLNPKIKWDEWKIKAVTEPTNFPTSLPVRRVGVAAAGYGGTNSHCIIENAETLVSQDHVQQLHRRLSDQPSSQTQDRPHLLVFSAHDNTTLKSNIAAFSKLDNKTALLDLAYTLSSRRTVLTSRAYAITRPSGMASSILNASQTITKAKDPTSISFCFTGQGAQWAGMGSGLFELYPSFARSIEDLDRVLQLLPDPPSWTIQASLLEPAATSRINEPAFSQSLCTAIQIAIVNLLEHWGIVPAATVGHSSGEIAAAYAAGYISAEDAMIAAFYRGQATSAGKANGAMLAVGVGATEITSYLQGFEGRIGIACHNSPQSLTLSGGADAINELAVKMTQANIFARVLKTGGMAYHSNHMMDAAKAYETYLEKLGPMTELKRHYRPRCTMISSVSGSLMGDMIPNSAYWIANLVSPVLFNQAVQKMVTLNAEIGTVVEVGPHAALAAPIRQICLDNKFNGVSYVETLARNKHDADQLLKLAGELWAKGITIDIGRVTKVERLSENRDITEVEGSLLLDLPTYQWNYSKQFWQEPRHSREIRGKAYARHDVLGRRIPNLNSAEPVWRNVLRHKDLPWLRHHAFGGEAIFPASGYFAMAIEAKTEMNFDSPEALPIVNYTLRNISIRAAMVVPDDDIGIETLFSLRRVGNGPMKREGDSVAWHSFSVSSQENGIWREHMTGMIGINTRKSRTPQATPNFPQHNSGASWYHKLLEVGADFGPTFQDMLSVSSDGKSHVVTAEMNIKQESRLMEGESRYVLHPGCIDSCLQPIMPSIHAGKLKDVACGVVFTDVEEMTIWTPTEAQLANAKGRAYARTFKRDNRAYLSNSQLTADDGQLLAEFTNVRCMSYEAAVPQTAPSRFAKQPYQRMEWTADMNFLELPQEVDYFSQPRLDSIVSLLTHKNLSMKILATDTRLAIDLLANLPMLAIKVAVISKGEEERFEKQAQSYKNVTTVRLDVASEDAQIETFDMVLASELPFTLSQRLHGIRRFLAPGGRLILAKNMSTQATVSAALKAAGFSGVDRIFRDIQAGLSTIISTASIYESPQASKSPPPRTILLVYRHNPAPLLSLIQKECSARGWKARAALLEDVKYQPGEHVIMLGDLEGPLLVTLNAVELKSLQHLADAASSMMWVTCGGLLSGQNPEYAMTSGLARSLTSENLSLDLVTLDYSPDSTSTEKVASIMLKIVDQHDSNTATKESEYLVDHGTVHVSRMVSSRIINEIHAPDDDQVLYQALDASPALKAVLHKGTIMFKEDDRYLEPLKIDDVTVQVKAVGLCKNEAIAISKSHHLSELAGIVTNVAPNVSHLKVGDRVAGFYSDNIATHQRVPAKLLQPFDEGQTFSEMASLPIPFVTAIYGLNELARVESGEVVIISDSTGPVGLAAMQICKMSGAKPLVVASTKQSIKTLSHSGLPSENILHSNGENLAAQVSRLTGGKGIDVMFCTSSTDLSVFCEIGLSIAPFARIVTFGTDNMTPQLDSSDALPKARSLSRFSFDLQDLLEAKPDLLARLWKRCMQLYNRGKISALGPVTVKTLSVVDDLLRPNVEETNLGKIIISYEGSVPVKILPTPPTLRFRPDATYLLVGCLGGLGRSLSSWMIERGAKHLAFMGRSGASSKSASSLITSVEAQGVDVKVIKSDVTVKMDVENAARQIDPRYPVRGVLNAAMVLDDGIFQNMTIDSWNTAVKPKVQGSQNLHEVFRNAELDFFVMTSSVSGTLGTPGQSNYAAANAYMDSLARHRRMQGLPAVSLILPMVLGVGYVAEHSELEDSLGRKGMYGIDEDELLRAFEVSMTPQPDPRTAEDHIVVGLDPSLLAMSASKADPANVFWLEDARFQSVKVAMAESSGGNGSYASGQSIVSTIKASKTTEEAVDATTAYLVQRLSRLLMIDAAEFQVDACSIGSYGLDSMIGAEFRNWVFREFKMDVPFQRLLAADLTISKFATDLCAKVRES